MKVKDVLGSACANLLRNKGRTLLTIIAIFIGAFTISLTTGVKTGATNYMNKQISGIGAKEQMAIQPSGAGGGLGLSAKAKPKKFNPKKKANELVSLSDKDIEKIKKMDGIDKVEAYPNLTTDYIEGKNGKKFLLTARPPSDVHVDLERGRQVATKGDAYEINLAQEYLKSLGYSSAKSAVGKTVKVRVSAQANGEQEIIEAKIVGVRNPSIVQGGTSIISKAMSDKVVEINERGLPDTMQHQYGALTAMMDKGISKSEEKCLKKELSDNDFSGATTEDEIEMIRNIINAITGVLTMFGAIALLAASFGIINTLYMSVQERTREIGLMKAMGLSSGKVFTIFSVEAALIGFFGSLLGVLAAVGVSKIINDLATTSFLTGLDGFKLVQFSMLSIGGVVLIIMLIAFLAGTLPARRAARLDPISSLRYE